MMNRHPEKCIEADTRDIRAQLKYLFYAASHEDRAAVEAEINANNATAANPVRFRIEGSRQ